LRGEELAPDELAIAPPPDTVGGAVIGKDEDVPDLLGQPGAEESREIPRRRGVEPGLDDRGVGEPRSPEIIEGLRV